MSSRVVLVDTNLLVLLIIGLIDQKLVGKNRRTSAYTLEDFHILEKEVTQYDLVMTTPNIATETCNLLGSALHSKHLDTSRTILAALSGSAEKYIKTAEASRDIDYHRLGLGDVSILIAAKEDVDVYTDDHNLYQALWKRGIKATNFTHKRSFEVS